MSDVIKLYKTLSNAKCNRYGITGSPVTVILNNQITGISSEDSARMGVELPLPIPPNKKSTRRPRHLKMDLKEQEGRIIIKGFLSTSEITGSATTSGTTTLTDSNADFWNEGVISGLTITNTTDSVSSTITSVNSSTSLTTTDNMNWDTDDEYRIDITPIIKKKKIQALKESGEFLNFQWRDEVWDGTIITGEPSLSNPEMPSVKIMEFSIDEILKRGKSEYKGTREARFTFNLTLQEGWTKDQALMYSEESEA